MAYFVIVLAVVFVVACIANYMVTTHDQNNTDSN